MEKLILNLPCFLDEIVWLDGGGSKKILLMYLDKGFLLFGKPGKFKEFVQVQILRVLCLSQKRCKDLEFVSI